MKILIIEDERLLAQSLQLALQRRGFQVELAHDGETGAAYADTVVYDLLVLDVMMPGMDGYTLARHVRSRHGAVPILMLTARSSVSDRVEGLNAGADYYLTKPFDMQELFACIHALLRREDYAPFRQRVRRDAPFDAGGGKERPQGSAFGPRLGL